jgi:hypothetical protein
MSVSIYGIETAQAAMVRAIEATKPESGMGSAVKTALTVLYRHAVQITHVDTGALRASHRMGLYGNRGEIYIDPGAQRGDGQRPAIYGPHEHRRGGAHAFYARTVEEAGATAGNEAAAMLRRYFA